MSPSPLATQPTTGQGSLTNYLQSMTNLLAGGKSLLPLRAQQVGH